MTPGTSSRVAVAVVVVALVVLAAVGSLGATVAMAQDDTETPTADEETRGEPDLEVWAERDEVTPGTDSPLEVTVQNEGDLKSGSRSAEVLTARGVTATIEDADEFEAASGRVSLGPIEDGASATAPLELEVPDDVDPGTYDVEIELEYAYTEEVSSDGEPDRETARETHDVTVEVPEEPRFEIDPVATDIEPGSSGNATVGVENVGTRTARDARVTFAGSGGVTIDGGASETAIGDLEPDESTNATVEAAVDDATATGNKSIEATFSYEDARGIERNATPVRSPFALGDEQSFSIAELEDSLAVGYDGEVSGEVRNDGPRTVDDAVLVAEPTSDSLAVRDTRYALPEIAPGETAGFSYPTDVTGDADPGDRQFRFTVEYTGSGDATLEDGPLSERVTVDEDADEFSIGDDDVSIRRGETREVVLEITNERPETLSNVDAMLYDDAPLEATDDEAFVDELEPGETASLRFELSVDDDATLEAHPVELDFEYETSSGETVLSDTYQHPIDVEEEPEDSGGFLSWLQGVLGSLSATASDLTAPAGHR